MAGRRSAPPRASQSLSIPPVEDQQTMRALTAVGQAVTTLQEARSRDVVTVDLEIGSNHVRHSLGRDVVGYSLTPTVASAAFAHAIDTTNSRPDREVWIDVIGAAQPGARIEVF
jgi:hypothetical protein